MPFILGKESSILEGVWFVLVCEALVYAIPSGGKEYFSNSDVPGVRSPENVLVELVEPANHGVSCDREYWVRRPEEDDLHIVLFKNRMLTGKLDVRIPNKNGSYSTHKVDSGDCFYHGYLHGGTGRIALSTCEGLVGMIASNDGKTLHIKPKIRNSAEHILFTNEDVEESSFLPKYGHVYEDNAKILEADFDQDANSNTYRIRRSVDPVLQTKYIKVVFVADNAFYTAQSSNLSQAIQRAMQMANVMDSIFKPQNFRIALISLEIWTSVDMFSIIDNPGVVLDRFSVYNRDTLIAANNGVHDAAMLLSGFTFSGGIVGLAPIGSICTGPSQAITRDWHSSASVSGGTAAHELGHLLGLADDNAQCTCTNSPCVMSAIASWTPYLGLSSCSVSSLEARCSGGYCLCLLDDVTLTYGGPICGNGFHETGEQCDCGSQQECTVTNCCNPVTCTLMPNAACAEGACCNTSTCQPLPAGVVCRANTTECDVPERCTGASHECPTNVYTENYASCDSNLGSCFQGLCSQSYDKQCQDLWGSGASKGNDICQSSLNAVGDIWGHCGANGTGGYYSCAPPDVLCGKLQCTGTNLPPFPIVGYNRMSRDSYYTVYVGGSSTTSYCRTGITHVGEDVTDPTVARDGMKCGTGKVCSQRKCQSVSSVVAACHDLCINGGVCTNTGYCYCPAGRACPNCASLDSLNTFGKVCSSPPQPIYPCANGRTVIKHGCYNQLGGTSFPMNLLLLNRRSNIPWGNYLPYLQTLICDCANVALSNNQEVIGIQFFGECWSTASTIASIQPGFVTQSVDGCKTVVNPGNIYLNCTPPVAICTGKEASTAVYTFI